MSQASAFGRARQAEPPQKLAIIASRAPTAWGAPRRRGRGRVGVAGEKSAVADACLARSAEAVREEGLARGVPSIGGGAAIRRRGCRGAHKKLAPGRSGWSAASSVPATKRRRTCVRFACALKNGFFQANCRRRCHSLLESDDPDHLLGLRRSLGPKLGKCVRCDTVLVIACAKSSTSRVMVRRRHQYPPTKNTKGLIRAGGS